MSPAGPQKAGDGGHGPWRLFSFPLGSSYPYSKVTVLSGPSLGWLLWRADSGVAWFLVQIPVALGNLLPLSVPQFHPL